MAAKTENIRWKQQFSNYTNAFEQLQETWHATFAGQFEMVFIAVNRTYRF